MADITTSEIKATEETDRVLGITRKVFSEMLNLERRLLFPFRYYYMTLERNGLCEHIIKLWRDKPVFKERWDEDELRWGCCWEKSSEAASDWCCLVRLNELPYIKTEAIDSLMEEDLSIFQYCIVAIFKEHI